MSDHTDDDAIPAIASQTEPTIWVSSTITEGSPTKDDPAPFRIVTKSTIAATPSMLATDSDRSAARLAVATAVDLAASAHRRAWDRERAEVGRRRSDAVGRVFPPIPSDEST